MSHFNFQRQMSAEDLQHHVAQRRQNAVRTNSMGMQPGFVQSPGMQQERNTMDMSMLGGDSLDEIIMLNNKELLRRQSYAGRSDNFGNDINMVEKPDGNNMLAFGNGGQNMNAFQFGQTRNNDSQSRRQSIDHMNVFQDMSNIVPTTGFPTAMQPDHLSIDTSGNYDMGDDMMSNGLLFTGMGDTTPLGHMYSDSGYANPYSANMQDFTMSMPMDDNVQNDMHDNNQNMMTNTTTAMPQGNSTMSANMMNAHFDSPVASIPPAMQTSKSFSQVPASPSHLQTAQSPAAVPDVSNAVARQTPKPPSFSNVYSSSGFDMLGALMRVATRKNPEIDIGAVDMSCAFVVCDVTQNDCPIIYVSDIFERLTGYNKHEVLGRNCRFLQAPDGKVVPGVKRKYVDDESVYYLKNRIKLYKEAQRSLINYRKGGQPFMNLLTMIPIPWDTDEIKYIVGFQVDLVEQPSSVAGKGPGGSYTVNYSQGLLPKYVWSPPDNARLQQESGQTISRDDVSQVLQNFNSNSDSEISKRLWDKVLLENTDDVVHVLSLKGLFLYLSPSARQVLEYDASELVGTALSSVCHPSDIVPVTRELKDTSTGATVNVVFRIRRKKSGYTWFEAHGSLCVEQGKGRKCIILVGRERPVYALQRHDIDTAGGIGESEMWAKLSTSGMILFISSNTRILLDRQSDELVGTSIQALMRPESRLEFNRMLERARTGKRVNAKHEVMNKRGQALQAHSTLYPGDASEGSKPTFLVGQIRLIKSSSRHVAPALTRNESSKSTSMSDVVMPGDALVTTDNREPATPKSVASAMSVSSSREFITTQAGSAGLAIGSQDAALASDDNIFDELKTTRCTSWQFELRQMEKSNRLLAEELAALLSNKKKRKRRKGAGNLQRDCANCHTRTTPEWRRGPSGNRDLCNSCGLRWAKQQGRVSPRQGTSRGDAGSKKDSTSPAHSSSPLHKQITLNSASSHTTKQSNGSAHDISTSSNPNLNKHPNPSATQVMAGNFNAATGSERRGTQESMPVHMPNEGFQGGGPNGITKIEEEPA